MREEVRGSVMIVMTVILLSLLGVVAFAVDTTIIAAAKSQHQHSAQYAALAALETYMTSAPAAATDEQKNTLRLEAAAARASSVSGLNIQASIIDHLTDSSQAQLGIEASSVPHVNGSVVPGKWHFEIPNPIPPGNYTTECSSDPTTFRPCFEKVDATEPANAIRVEMNTDPASPLRTMFAAVLGQGTFEIQSKATASLIPRHAMFVLDVSPSIVEETHSDMPYAIQLKNLCPGPLPIVPPGRQYDYNDFEGSENYDPVDYPHPYDQLESTRPNYLDPSGHYKSDYRGCITVKITENGVENTVSFLIDNYHTSIRGPQPLTGILDAVRFALESFRNRAVTADRVGVLAFDDRVLHERRTHGLPFEDGIGVSALIKPAASAADPEFDAIYAATRTNSSILNAARNSKLLFPLQYGGERWDGVIPLGPYTDLRKALQESVDSLEHADFSNIAERFIVLFSDGISNCVESPPAGAHSRCNSEDEGFFDSSMQEAINVIDTFATRRIDLHLLLTGALTRPHTVVRTRDDRCMTDYESRQDFRNTPNVVWTGGSLVNPPFYKPNMLWNEIAENSSSSAWLPLRPCCKRDGVCTDVSAEIGQACKTRSEQPGAVDGELITNLPGWVDESGRLACDPWGRSVGVQAKDAIDRIMRRNPYVLVE